jgi:hypothetical protein
MLAHNAHVVYCSKHLTAKVMLVPIMLHYFWLCLAHDCNVNAHAKNIPTLLMTVLCPILCKRKLLITQRLKAKFLVPPQLGGTSGVSVCTPVQWLYISLVINQGTYQSVQTVQTSPNQSGTSIRRALTNQKPQNSLDKHHPTTRALYKTSWGWTGPSSDPTGTGLDFD